MTYRIEVSFYGTWLLSDHVKGMDQAREAALRFKDRGFRCRIVLCVVLEEYDG